MNRTLGLRLAGVLILMFGFGLSSIATQPDGGHTGFMWPVGLASGALVLCSRPATPYVVAAIATLTSITFLLGVTGQVEGSRSQVTGTTSKRVGVI